MSRLGDLENVIVSRLASATFQSAPLFQTVRGISGGYQPMVREALRRERMPAAYVAFMDEPTAPEVKAPVRGAHWVVLVVTRTLRVESDPRHGDTDTLGAFTLLEQARLQLDDYEPSPGFRLQNLREKFVDADDRVAVYELLYRVWPVVEAPLTFAGQALAGSASRMTLELGPLEMEQVAFRFPGLDGTSLHLLGLLPRQIVWRGELRGTSDSDLNGIESNIETTVSQQTSGDIADGTSRVFSGCVLERFVRRGSRRPGDDGQTVVQDVELHFLQLNPL